MQNEKKPWGWLRDEVDSIYSPRHGPVEKWQHVGQILFRLNYEEEMKAFNLLNRTLFLTKRDITILFNDLAKSTLWFHLIRRRLIDTEKAFVKMDYHHGLDEKCLNLAWFHGVEVVCGARFYNCKCGHPRGDQSVRRFMAMHQSYLERMVVLRGLRLLPEHWREAVEFLGYL